MCHVSSSSLIIAFTGLTKSLLIHRNLGMSSITFEDAVDSIDSMFGGSVDREVIMAMLESNGKCVRRDEVWKGFLRCFVATMCRD